MPQASDCKAQSGSGSPSRGEPVLASTLLNLSRGADGWRCHSFHFRAKKGKWPHWHRAGEPSSYALPQPWVPHAARWRWAALWAPSVHGISQSEVPKSVSLQSGYVLSPIPVFTTQTYQPNPNLPDKKGSAVNFFASHDKSCRIFSYSESRSVFSKVQHLYWGPYPLPHLLTLRVLFYYLVSFTFRLFFQYFFFLGLKLC